MLSPYNPPRSPDYSPAGVRPSSSELTLHIACSNACRCAYVGCFFNYVDILLQTLPAPKGFVRCALSGGESLTSPP